MAFKPIEILINAKDNASSVFSSLQGKVAAVGAAIATYFGINAFAGVVKGAADLEQGLSRVQAATGASAAEMAKLRAAAEDAGANTKFTAVEAAGALENLAKAGLNSVDAIAALPAVLQLAAAGDIDLATSSEYVTKAVMGMGLAFTDAGRVADVLALGANATNTSVTGLAQALSYAAPVANSLGLSLESTVAIIGKFADAGIDASRAGTALNSILSQFSDPASKFRQELAAAGITTGDFEKAIHQLAAAGPAGSKAILSVGQEAGPALRALLNQGMGALDELTVKLKSAEGSAAAAAKVMQDNLNGSLSGLASAWDTVKNALGTPVLPVLKDGVDQLAAAFRGAVADGTVQRFGETIATAFQNGMKWVREFVGSVDFAQVTASLRDLADRTGQIFTQVGEHATNAAGVLRVAYGTIQASGNTLMAGLYGAASGLTLVIQGVLKGLEMLYLASSKVTFGAVSEQYKQIAADLKIQSDGMGAAVDALGERVRASLGGIGNGLSNVTAGFSGLAGATQETAASTVASTGAMAAMAKELTNGADAAAKAGAAYQKKVNDEQIARQSATEHRAAIEQLKAEYADLVASGSIQAAAEKLQEINKALAGTPPAGKEAARAAADAAAQIEAAFGRLGVTSSAELSKQAANAQRDYQTIKAAGTSTAQDISEAFRVAAERAIAANKGIAPSWVVAEAGVRGFKLEVDETGKTIVRSMKDAEDSVHRVGRAAGGKVGGFQSMGRAAMEASKELQKLYDRHRLVSEQSDKDLADMRKNTSGNVTVSQDYVNAEIARMWGDSFVGDKDAEALFHAKAKLAAYRNNYGNVVRSQESLNEQRGVQQLVERLEQKLRERQAELTGKQTTESTGGRGQRSDPAPQSGGSGSATGVSRAGAAAGPTYVSNITIPGVARASLRFTDQQSQAQAEQLLRVLTTGRGTSR